MKQELIVLTSPPASGKTFWIKSFEEAMLPETILIVSPLRALADECKERWHEKIRIVTPEEWMLTQARAEIVIFDEFHLYFYWGDTFRPLLWEVFFALTSSSRLTILLTATLADFMKNEILNFGSHFDRMLWCDYGNQVLKYHPQKYIMPYSKTWLTSFIKLGPRGKGVNLIFCAYRDEVFEWEIKLTKLGYKVWTCVGGEAQLMRGLVKSGESPDFIIATTVLSHGVNLPAISCVFFLYTLNNLDFWIQMVARGGRQGNAFEIFSLEKPHGIKWHPWTNFLAILGLSFKMKLIHYFRQADQWFLKE